LIEFFLANAYSRVPSWVHYNSSPCTQSKQSRSFKRSSSAPLPSSNPSPTRSTRIARNGSSTPSGSRNAAAYVMPQFFNPSDTHCFCPLPRASNITASTLTHAHRTTHHSLLTQTSSSGTKTTRPAASTPCGPAPRCTTAR
jgi:hypothetical protein